MSQPRTGARIICPPACIASFFCQRMGQRLDSCQRETETLTGV